MKLTPADFFRRVSNSPETEINAVDTGFDRKDKRGKQMAAFNRFFASAVICAGFLGLISGQVQAQRGGSGGGGGGSSSGLPANPLVFDAASPINGKTATWSGDFTISNPIPGYYTWSTLNLSIKAKPLNLDNGASLRVTVYMTDTVTGDAIAPFDVPSMIVTNGLAASKSSVVVPQIFTAHILPRLDRVVVKLADGTILMSCHP